MPTVRAPSLPGGGHRAQHVGRAAAGGDADQHVAGAGSRAPPGPVLPPPDRPRRPPMARARALLSSGNDPLDQFRRYVEGRRAFRGVEHAQPSAGARADVEQAARRPARLRRWRLRPWQYWGFPRATASATLRSSALMTRRICSVPRASMPSEAGLACSVSRSLCRLHACTQPSSTEAVALDDRRLQALKELPQPQVFLTFGLLNLNPDPSRVST